MEIPEFYAPSGSTRTIARHPTSTGDTLLFNWASNKELGLKGSWELSGDYMKNGLQNRTYV